MEIIERRFLQTSSKSVHAATIEMFNDHPVFAWFGGEREGDGNVCIWIQNLNGNNNITCIGCHDNSPRWNPILYNNNGKLFLFEKIGVFCDRWQTFVTDITNLDHNLDREEEIEIKQILPAGLNGPVKTRPLNIGDNIIVCGSSVETFCDWTSYFESYKFIDSKIEFITRSNPIFVSEKVPYNKFGRKGASLGIIQPALWVDENGFQAFYRSSYGLGKIYYTSSSEYQKVGKPVPTNLPNPNSGIDVVCYKDRLFLVSNPSDTYRFPLVIQEIKLKDLSDTFAEFDIIDTLEVTEKIDRNIPCNSNELSYPYMIESNGELHLVYTYGRSYIEYCVISI